MVCFSSVLLYLNATEGIFHFFSADEFRLRPSELRFFPGETEKCFEVQALRDSTLEETIETFSLGPLRVTDSLFQVTLNESNSLSVIVLDTDWSYKLYIPLYNCIQENQEKLPLTRTACCLCSCDH